MARVHHVKKARKDYPEYEIKKGESYYWWKFRFGPKKVSKTYPKRSETTQSSFYATLWDIQDRTYLNDPESVEDDIQSMIEDIEMLRDECQDSLDNMPENLQESSESGALLQERIDGLESWISDLENIDTEFEEGLSEEEINNRFEEILAEVENCDPGL